jgi:hypothetical protein
VLKTFAVAAATLSLIGGAGWGLQAISLVRPGRAELELVKTLRALDAFRGSRATIELNGLRYRALCTQHWYPGKRSSSVLLARVGVAGPGRVSGGTALGREEPELAGCPRRLGAWISYELLRGASVRVRTLTVGRALLHEVELRPRTIPIVLLISRQTNLPVQVRVSATGVKATSVLDYDELR